MDKASLISCLDHLPDAALLLDEGGRLEGANQLALELLRVPREELHTITTCGAEGWCSPGRRRVRLGKVNVDVAVRDVSSNGESLCLAILREAPPDVPGQVIDTWEIGVIEYDVQNPVLRATPRVYELFGLDEGVELTREELTNALHPDERAEVLKTIKDAEDPNGSGLVDHTNRIVTSGGEVRWLRRRATTHFELIDGERRATRTLVSVMDVTKEHELTLMLNRHQERMRLATEGTGVGIFDRTILPHGLPPYWSESMRKLMGYDSTAPADVEWFFDRVHPGDMETVLKAADAANHPQGDGRVEAMIRWFHPDGNIRRFIIRSTTMYPENDEEGAKARSIGALLDVTERSAAEDELRSRSAILDTTPDFVGIADEAGRVTYLNKAGRSFWGVGETDSVSNLTIGTLHSSASRQRLFEIAMPTVRRDGVWTGESLLRRHDGKMIMMSQVILAHRTSSGEMLYSVVARDLSKLKLLEEQYRQAQKMEAIGRLAGGVAHDFNNLLSVIMGGTELARIKLDAENPAREDLDEVMLAAEGAAGLTRQLLAFGRKQTLKPSVLDINHVLYEMTEMMHRLVDESIEVRVRLVDEPVQVKADHTQVQQILLNLVVNSRDAMPDGGVLTVEALKGSLGDDETLMGSLGLPAGPYSIITVSDTGHGMDEETREKIFEPFFTTKRPEQGTGLGLATVFGIVRQSGGAIWVDSEVGRGTTFKIYLPASDELPAPPETPRTRRRPERSGVVLLAEDDDQLRRMVSRTLRQVGYEVISADTCTEVLEAAQAYDGKIDLLLTDVIMPGMSGKQLARRILESRPNTSVLYMSGYTDDTIAHHGALVNFVAKPVTPTRLLAAVDEVLGRLTHNPVA